MADQPLYSIGSVARMLRISPATLRTWEERYGTVVPARTAGGHRVYSRAEVEQLRHVGESVAAGLSPADAYRILQEFLDSRSAQAEARSPGPAGLLIVLSEHDPRGAGIAEYLVHSQGCDIVVVTDTAQSATATATALPRLSMIELSTSDGEGLQLRKEIQDRFVVAVLAVFALVPREWG